MRARRLASGDSPDVSHVSYGTIKIFDGATDRIAQHLLLSYFELLMIWECPCPGETTAFLGALVRV